MAERKPPHFIREWRQRKGKTLEWLGEAIGMTHQNLGKIERRNVDASLTNLAAIAQALGIETVDLLRHPDDPEGITTLFRRIPDADKPTVTKLIRSMAVEDIDYDVPPTSSAPAARPAKRKPVNADEAIPYLPHRTRPRR